MNNRKSEEGGACSPPSIWSKKERERVIFWVHLDISVSVVLCLLTHYSHLVLLVLCPSCKRDSPDAPGNVNQSLFGKLKRQAAGFWVMRAEELCWRYSESRSALITGNTHTEAALLTSHWLSFAVWSSASIWYLNRAKILNWPTCAQEQ